MYYQVFRGDGSSKNYKILSEMLEDFDRLDVEELFRLVKERYSIQTEVLIDALGRIYILYLKFRSDRKCLKNLLAEEESRSFITDGNSVDLKDNHKFRARFS
ncbi:hypothetical protein Tco_1523295 [Tanacetum coccineum]